MSHEESADTELTFGEKLLGLQGFSAARAKHYRAELEKLLAHRLTTFERWTTGIMGVYLAATLTIAGIWMASGKEHPEFSGFDQVRLTIGATCAITGLVVGGWLLRIAIQGGYGRRLGDVMGVFIAPLLCGGCGFAFFNMAWDTTDMILRTKLLFAGGALVVLMAACLIVAHFQRLHRQTQEKLLRIEYHLAELSERDTESASP